MGDFIRRFDLGHIRQLDSVNAQAFSKVYSASEKPFALAMDIDSTLDEVYETRKEGAKWAYTGIRALNRQRGTRIRWLDWLG
jgi:hypothetical protein